MGKSKKINSRLRTLSDGELMKRFDVDLDTLARLCTVYDGGYPPISLSMSTLIHKILVENNAATRARGNLVFSSPDFGEETRMLNALNRLIGVTLNGSPPILSFVPNFYLENSSALKSLSFRNWWNRDVIYRASAALPGTPAGLIPVNGSPSVPFEKRETLSRREFIAIVRNKIDAHQDEQFPILLDEIEETLNFGSFAVDTPEGQFSTHDGSLVMAVGPIAAMMREIAHELLVAYGRSDPIP